MDLSEEELAKYLSEIEQSVQADNTNEFVRRWRDTSADPKPSDLLQETTRKLVPLTILTGWLGAGKTSFLHWILSELSRTGKTVAILQNETSDVMGVEAALKIQDDSGTFASILELKNGCVCCSVRSDFATAIEQLLAQRSFDYVVVECSGIADAGQLAGSLWLDNELESKIFLDAVLTVVDVTTLLHHLRQELPHSKIILRQIAHADCILLNKIDLLEKAQTAGDKDLTQENVETALRELNSAARIVPTVRSQVPLKHVLDLKAFTGAGTLDTETQPQTGCCHQHDQAGHTCHEHCHPGTGHSTAALDSEAKQPHGISTIVLEVPCLGLKQSPDAKLSPGVKLRALKVWLTEELWSGLQNSKELLRANQAAGAVESALVLQAQRELSSITTSERESIQDQDANTEEDETSQVIFRIKGVVALPDEPRKLYLQGVHQLFEVDYAMDQNGEVSTRPADVWPEDSVESRVSRVIVIGLNLQRERLEEGFKACFEPATGSPETEPTQQP